ncbi:hypothetical protein GE061_005928 [Apolygus lucorum]|uniref:Ferritin n=1 Tax=Apolygus lucorum TaxID=248454 RepID=A0A8S9WRS2_APOLU|nr:hypothetical protein GE061_005928 [Apolygus lucorum]
MLVVTEAIFQPLVHSIRKSFSSLCKTGGSHIRFKFPQEVEEGISRQITAELDAAYAYFSMASVFGRDSVALPGFHELFKEFSNEELQHANHWIDYINLRGGNAKFQSIKAPPDNVDWTPLCAVAKAIDMETKMTQELLKLRELAEKHNDVHAVKFIEDDYLVEQYDGLKKLGDLKSQIERVGDDGVGIYIMDHNILRKYEKKKTPCD